MLEHTFSAHFLRKLLLGLHPHHAYRTSDRTPLIEQAPSNRGLYQTLYSQAASAIGCQLEIVRGPKKRILKMLEDGEVDFYPGFNFNPERARYTYYIVNGLPGGDVGISRNDFITVTQLSELEGHTVVQALGSPNFVRDLENVTIYAKPEITIDQAVAVIRKKRADFYIYNRSSIDYYFKQHQPNDMKIHPNCCGEIEPLYLGFSRRSPHFSETINPNYDANQPLSVSNFPTVINSQSIAYHFQKALADMASSGESAQIYRHYFQ
ncbi:substrate-binding periplasmic protein [Vibrio mexicanus]|uniref:substrate-binding periplasmic protein n=1 Tax=Vibrio mexicanus TaxID=1004326 RepID=UPI001EE24345|nr:transporter substrate-binding domain-containing protein [Vibrio mexicanus]